MENSIRVQVPDLTFSLYGGTVTIDFYEKYVTRGHAYDHVYIHRETGDWPVSVTRATGMVDKSTPLGIWQERLSYEMMLRALPVDDLKLAYEALNSADPKAVSDGQGYSNGTLAKRIAKVLEHPELITPRGLDAMLIFQATAQHKIERDEGASLGGMVHTWIDLFLQGKKPSMPAHEKVLNGVNGFLAWFGENDVEVVHNEKIVYSKEHDFVGKLDVLIRARVPGRDGKHLVMFDYKTNNWPVDKKTGVPYSRIYPEQRYQQAAYKGAWDEERPGEEIAGRHLLCIDKLTGEFDPHFLDLSTEAFAKDYKCFLGALALKKRDKELEREGKP